MIPIEGLNVEAGLPVYRGTHLFFADARDAMLRAEKFDEFHILGTAKQINGPDPLPGAACLIGEQA